MTFIALYRFMSYDIRYYTTLYTSDILFYTTDILFYTAIN